MSDNKKIIFIGSAQPDGVSKERQTLSFNIADNIAQNVIIKGLSSHYGDKVTVISESAIDYPDGLDLGYGVTASVVRSSNKNKIAYYLSLAVNYSRNLNAILKDEYAKGGELLIITRGSYIFIALPVLLARMRYRRIKWIPFIITTVEVPEYKFPLSLISKLSRWSTKKADAMITYVAKTAIDYMPKKPYLEIVYSIGDEPLRLYAKDIEKSDGKFTIAYTGALSETYNFKYVIDAIIKTGKKYHWVFAGSGYYSTAIKEIANDGRYDVEYLGSISNTVAINVQKKSNLLICPRGGNLSFSSRYYAKYAASGKLIEYLYSGTPALVTDVPSISSEVRKFILFESNNGSESFTKDLAEIEKNYSEKVITAKKGQKYALKYFNAEYQNKKIYDFLENL